jgi:hypothetical protein
MYGDYDSHIVSATRANILASVSSTTPYGMASPVDRTLAYCFTSSCDFAKPVASVGDLSPVIFSAQNH